MTTEALALGDLVNITPHGTKLPDGSVIPRTARVVDPCHPTDAGAIPYVVNGADIMRPGIVSCTDDVKAGSPVQIVDERHGKPLAIGIALMDAPDLRASTAGKMVKKFHHVGDEIWTMEI